MASYLEAYGAAEEQHSKRIRLVKFVLIALAVVLVLGGTLFAVFRNHSEERQIENFVDLLQKHDYQAAYRMWGCTDAHPCPGYTFVKFQEDWGPASPHANESTAKIGLSQSCGSGVVLRIDYQGSEEPVSLWVERDTGVISFAPWAECPGRHLRLGAWWKSLFGKS